MFSGGWTHPFWLGGAKSLLFEINPFWQRQLTSLTVTEECFARASNRLPPTHSVSLLPPCAHVTHVRKNSQRWVVNISPRSFWLGLAYVLFPLNLLVYGLNVGCPKTKMTHSKHVFRYWLWILKTFETEGKGEKVSIQTALIRFFLFAQACIFRIWILECFLGISFLFLKRISKSTQKVLLVGTSVWYDQQAHTKMFSIKSIKSGYASLLLNIASVKL